MTALRYSAYARHKVEHEVLLLRVHEVQRRCGEGMIAVNDTLVAFLKSWLNQHIKEADVRLGSYLRSKGLQ